jgi:hypothetical protein
MERFLKFTAHATTMMHERMIQEEWITRTVTNPDTTEERNDEEIHFLKQIPEAGGKTLRVIINPRTNPRRVITVFFDRRANHESDC